MTTSAERDARLRALLARMNAPFARALSGAELRAAIGRRGLESAIRHGALVRLLPDTYVSAAIAESHAARCAAVLRWGRGHVLLTGASVLHLYDQRFACPEKVHCVAALERRFRIPPWVALRRRRVGAWSSSVRGQSCVPLEEAVVDAWRAAAPDRRIGLVYEVLWRRIVTARALGRVAASASRVPERRRLLGVVEGFIAGDTSPAEVMARHEVFTGPAWRSLEWQVALIGAGRRRVADAVHRGARVVVEFDGAAFHDSPEAVRRDRERDAELAASGWITVRFGYRDLRDRPQWCRDALASVIASRWSRDGT
ncbi:endonuclease domain-containing protein [Demequina capsici]|uniref:DUF559 domain-containing protein n=1 Tax=Demequina capsici TaxID=3075620 RepID=A0AA96F7Z0_9MICO|nr:DUF559 domain-containing protein [Demequina sp. OYTSA14]WNM24295.1 DUF559 domain-containing protein [Demequina sp. OYTSA14]